MSFEQPTLEIKKEKDAETGDSSNIIKSPEETKVELEEKSKNHLGAMLSGAQKAIELFMERGLKEAQIQLNKKPPQEFFDILEKKGYQVSAEFGEEEGVSFQDGKLDKDKKSEKWQCWTISIKW
jgi:hypothetical protein